MSASPAAHKRLPAKALDEAGYFAFLEGRDETEKWDLIDGTPIQQMNPPTFKHVRIAANLERQLNSALATSRLDLDAIRELPLAFDGDPPSRLIADVAIVQVDALLDEDADPTFHRRFFLAAEVLSPSNRPSHIGRKRELYTAASECLHVLIISQDSMAVEVWSRSNDWKGRVFRSAGDLIELPEFGFSCRLGDLYRGTSIP